MESWQTEALAHAHSGYPREVCGLVVVHRGRRRYEPCRNTSERSEDCFELHPDDYARAEETGEIVGVFHSHPNAPATPSAHDLSACRASGVDWHIASIPGESWAHIPHEESPRALYGREFVHGDADCYGFIRAWYAQERGIQLLDFVRSDDWWMKGQNLYIDNFETAGFRRVTDSMRQGDVLLMQVQSNVPNHAAIFLDGDQIGHHLYGRLSSREVYGGYWRKHTTHTLRYFGNAA